MTDYKLTDEQIERAFEICYGIDKVVGCTFCPLYDEEEFCLMGDVPLAEQFFDVYKHKKAEIDILIRKNNTLKDEIAELKAEVERLQNAYKQCAWERDIFAEDQREEIRKEVSILQADVKKLKSEARKEFWHKLKQKKKWDIDMPDHIYVSDGDNLLKEMDGDTE